MPQDYATNTYKECDCLSYQSCVAVSCPKNVQYKRKTITGKVFSKMVNLQLKNIMIEGVGS